MNRYRRYIPIIAIVLVAFGVNLDRLGIDLEALSRGESIDITNSGNSNSSDKNATLTNSQSGQQQGNNQQSHPSGKQWSSTSPEINLWHVFEGEINRKGKPTGYHSRPGGVDAANARIVSIKDKPNRAGVYTANIEVRDGGQWKSKFSSFFPDSMSKNDVIDAVIHAYSNSQNKKAQPWQGPSGLGFSIQGYTTSRGGINTAFPVYQRNQ